MERRDGRWLHGRRVSVFLKLVFSFALVSPAWAEDGLPVFTRQPSCEETGNTNLLRLRAVVSGAESLQWMSNDVPVVGGTNLTIEFAPDLKNVTAYVLIASNSAGVVPSQLMWAHACEAYAFDGVVQLDSTEQLVLDRNGVPTADGWVKLYVARIAEELGPWGHWRIPIPALQVKDGRIANVPRPVLYRPGTRVYAQFRKVDFPGADEEHGFSKIFEATVGTTSEPGSLDAVEPWEFRSIFCYGLKRISFPTLKMQVGRSAQVRADVFSYPCSPFPPGVFYSDNWRSEWRKNGVPIDATHPISDTNRAVTLADAGFYELYQRDDYMVGGNRFVVRLQTPADFRVTQVEEGRVRLSIRSESTGNYRLEQSTNLVEWSLLQEGNYTNRASTVEVPIMVSGGAKFYRLK